MSGQIISEGQFLISCVAAGVCITVVYDVLRIFRRVLRHGTVLVAAEDLLFWMAAAVFLFYVLYKTNNGVIRWFSVAGAGIGMLVYKTLIGEHLVALMSTFLNYILDIVSRLFKRLFHPAKRLFNRISGKMRKVGRKIKKRAKKKLTGNIKKVKITLCKHNQKEKWG